MRAAHPRLLTVGESAAPPPLPSSSASPSPDGGVGASAKATYRDKRAKKKAAAQVMDYVEVFVALSGGV